MSDTPGYDPTYRRIDRRVTRAIRRFPHWAAHVSYCAFWWTAHKLGIGWKLGKILCRMGLYRTHKLNGVCAWCGLNHKNR